MDKSKIEFKTIDDLLKYNFFIPSYQRGYRWTTEQIKDLLEDVNAFTPKQVEKTDKKTWYCLQPVVVKECDEKTKKKNNLKDAWYEVIDGQQRLTSIFLIIHYANEMWIGKRKKTEFKIKYETRKEDFEFLQNLEINESTDKAIINNDNIDFHHITKAYNEIHDWVKNSNKNFDNNDFQSKLASHSKVIWYEVSTEKDAIEIFTRINMGKIPLTNAELIKALFLNSSNFSVANPEEIRLKQLEIASEWDRMEYSLQNDELWCFINEFKNELPNRIEFVFAVMEDIKGEKNDNSTFSTFRFFLEKFKSNSKKDIDKNWKEIKTIFQTIEEWFGDRELYHKIGYLISTGEKIKDLLKDAENKQKRKFKLLLDEKITKKVECENLENLKYGDKKIKNILLLHNIQTMLNNKKETSRFPFNRYKSDSWDIEHIHAIATEMPSSKQHRIDWLNDSKEFIKDEKICKDIESFIESYDEKTKGNKDKTERFEKLANEVLKYYSEQSNGGTDNINDLSNLVLLDYTTNRGYKNAVFPAKRKTIIEKEKNGKFIPICTKNVFLKYYTDNVDQMTFWDKKNKADYFEDLKKNCLPMQ